MQLLCFHLIQEKWKASYDPWWALDSTNTHNSPSVLHSFLLYKFCLHLLTHTDFSTHCTIFSHGRFTEITVLKLLSSKTPIPIASLNVLAFSASLTPLPRLTLSWFSRSFALLYSVSPQFWDPEHLINTYEISFFPTSLFILFLKHAFSPRSHKLSFLYIYILFQENSSVLCVCLQTTFPKQLYLIMCRYLKFSKCKI